jgi:hypothetical protein
MNKIEVRFEAGFTTIQNSKYPNTVHCDDKAALPDIGVPYVYLQWSDQVWLEKFYIDNNNHIQNFTEAQLTTISNICKNWTQPLGQPGNYTAEQIAEQDRVKKILEAKQYLIDTDHKMLPNYVLKASENLELVITKRNEAREFIRSNV